MLIYRTSSRITLVLLLSVTQVLGFEPSLARVESAAIIVPDNYPSIQEAVNAASIGDTILVRSGIYYEYVRISGSVSLMGEDSKTTIIDAGGVEIRANETSIANFTIRNSAFSGIYLGGVSGCSISNNIIVNNTQGIDLSMSSNNDISGNAIVDNYNGILLDYRSNYNIIPNNTVTNNYNSISVLHSSDHNTIYSNRIANYANGIWVAWSDYNTVANNVGGISLAWSNHNTVANNVGGISLAWSNHNTVANNTVLEYSTGIRISASSNNSILANYVLLNYNGIVLRGDSNNNTILENNFANNDCGVWLSGSSNNRIWHNNFIKNKIQVSIEGDAINIWDDGYPSGGNYWSDYGGLDLYSSLYQNQAGGDGIGDAPYFIAENNTDRYPLMNRYLPPLGDLNDDGKVDVRDIAVAARAFGSYPGRPEWKPEADINLDSKVDIRDIALIARDFGKTSH